MQKQNSFSDFNVESPLMNKAKTLDAAILEQPNYSRYLVLKFLFDRLLAVPLLVCAMPIIAIAALAIKYYSPGPVFFAHERVGYRGKKIRVWKLRTMHLNAQELLEVHLSNNPSAQQTWEAYFKLKDDPRIIPVVGNSLRKTSMDELPQLWNVLKGDMSLVGPRPFPKYHLEAFPIGFQQLRQQVMPGLTGLWQISARSEGDIKVQELLDTQYIEKRSFTYDMKMLLKTVYAVLAQKGAH